MSKVCFRKATRTSTRTVSTSSKDTSYGYTLLTLPPSVSPVRYTSTCVVTIGCSDKLATSYTPVPGRVITRQVPVATRTVYGYATYVTPLYATSCTVYTGALPTTITDIVNPSDIPPVSQSDDSQAESVPVGTIVGAVIGSLGGAMLIGILIYLLCFRRNRTKGVNNSQYPVSPLSPYTLPQGGHLIQPFGSGELNMRSRDETPYTSSGNVLQQSLFQSGQNPYSHQGPETGISSQGPSMGQPALAIVSRSSVTAPGAPGHTQGAVSRPVSSSSSHSPPLGSELYPSSTLGHHSASNPITSFLHQHRLSQNRP